MDVVANTGAVRGRVVGSVQGDGFALPQSGLEDDWDEVSLRPVVFAAQVCSAGGVEVAQRGVADAAALLVPGQHMFYHQLTFAVGIDWPSGRIFSYGY